MASNNARRAARRIEQNAVERFTIPPGAGLRGICRKHLCGLQTDALQCVVDPLTTRGIDIQCRHIMVSQFQQVRCFAAGRGACVQQPQSILRLACLQGLQQQRRSQLRSRVLHRYQPLGKARQLLHRARFFKQNSVRSKQLSRHACRQQMLLQILRRCYPARIDPQMHRWLPLPGQRDRQGIVRMIRLQPRPPPGRQVEQFRAMLRTSLAATLLPNITLT